MTENNPSQTILATHAGVYRPLVPQFLGTDFTSKPKTVKYHITHTSAANWQNVGEDGVQPAGFNAAYCTTQYPEVIRLNGGTDW